MGLNNRVGVQKIEEKSENLKSIITPQKRIAELFRERQTTFPPERKKLTCPDEKFGPSNERKKKGQDGFKIPKKRSARLVERNLGSANKLFEEVLPVQMSTAAKDIPMEAQKFENSRENLKTFLEASETVLEGSSIAKNASYIWPTEQVDRLGREWNRFPSLSETKEFDKKIRKESWDSFQLWWSHPKRILRKGKQVFAGLS